MNLVIPYRVYASRVRPRPLHIGRVLLITACVLFAVALGAIAFMHTDLGRRTLADMIERVVSGAIPGRMSIGRIETLGWAEPVLDDVRFFHPNGKPVLIAKRASVELDVAALLHGQLAFHRARVEGGFIAIEAQPDGRTNLEAAFDDGVSSRPEDRDDYLRMQLRSIFVDGMTAVLRPSASGDPVFRLHDVQGFVAIQHLDTPGVRVRLDRITAELETPKFLGEQLTIAHADGWVHGKETQVLDLDLETQLGAGYLDGHLAYYDRKRTPVELELEPKSGVMPHVATIALEAQSWFTDTLDVDVR